jgi:hypothetical protein
MDRRIKNLTLNCEKKIFDASSDDAQVVSVIGAGEQEGKGVGEGNGAAAVAAIDEGVVVLLKAEINERLLQLPKADSDEVDRS